MGSAKKQDSKVITSSFLGSEDENQKLLSKKKILTYAPNVEFFMSSQTETLIAVVRMGNGSDKTRNPVYRITDLRLVRILEAFAEASGGRIYFYKVPIGKL